MAQRKTPAKSTVYRRPAPVGGGVVIAWIHPGQVSSYFNESLLTTTLTDFGRPDGPRIVNFMQEWSSANVSASRNTVTQRFLDSPVGEWLLWIDADMQWDPVAVDQLLAVADPVKCPVVGGLCFGMANGRLWPTVYQFTKTDTGLTTYRDPTYERDALVEVAATGAAFLLIHRSVLEAIKAREFSEAFPWFQETELRGQPVGEDLTFCFRARMCDFPVYVHTGVKVGHHKSNLLTEEMFLAQPEEG